MYLINVLQAFDVDKNEFLDNFELQSMRTFVRYFSSGDRALLIPDEDEPNKLHDLLVAWQYFEKGGLGISKKRIRYMMKVLNLADHRKFAGPTPRSTF